CRGGAGTREGAMPVFAATPTSALSVPAAVLLVGVCVGHLALMVRLHNWLYGLVVSRFWNHRVRDVVALATPAFVVALWYRYGLDWTGLVFAPANTAPA